MELNRVCWIGGSARAGKTTIANRFNNANVKIYHTDDIFTDKSIITEENQPFMWMMHNEGYLNVAKRPLTEYTEIYLNICKEAFLLMEKQLTDLLTTDIVIVEGICLLPDLLYDRGISNACFLISPQNFFEEVVAEMKEFQAKLQELDESTLIFDNVTAMMNVMRAHIEEKARKYQYNIISVDKEHDVDVNTRLIKEYFSLPQSDKMV